ncbi:hypothetical protein IL306_008893 [Fusarium sp. DS 682]|nr:hypothetical protein IL306_008893 [Fusarium sp. DS 682]
MAEHPAVPPSIREFRAYYSGLPDGPNLVARSSTTPWKPCPTDVDSFLKLLDPVEKHPVVPLWNDSAGPLRRKVLEAVKDIDWNAIDILRCGSSHEGDHYLVRPVILFVSVEPESTTWSHGRAVALKCRDILREHGINDVEVEIKESRITQCCSSDGDQAPRSQETTAKLSPDIQTIQEEAYRRDSIQLSELLGTKIASTQFPTREGTKGLYLRIRNTGTVVALTCRHVVFGEEEENFDFYHAVDNTRGVIQPGTQTIQDTTKSLREDIRRLDFEIKHYETLTPPGEKELEVYRAHKIIRENSLQRHEQFESVEARTIGHVLFSPKFGVSSSSPGRFRDWALIELHQDKHQTPLAKLENIEPMSLRRGVFSSLRETLEWRESKEEARRIIPLPGFNPETQTQTGVMSEDEMRNPGFDFQVPGRSGIDQDYMRLWMFGGKSEQRLGVTNTARSVIRRVIGGIPMISEEWCILGYVKNGYERTNFSTLGDSGTCIMGHDGRVAAILTSGALTGRWGRHHISYATPIDWLLEDIRSYGFDVEWMGEQWALEHLHYRLESER